jgi:hypothetical protein
MDDNTGKPDKAIWQWEKNIFADGVQTPVLASALVKATPFGVNKDPEDDNNEYSQIFSFQTTKRTKSFFWDPTIGVSSGNISSISLLLSVFVIFILF